MTSKKDQAQILAVAQVKGATITHGGTAEDAADQAALTEAESERLENRRIFQPVHKTYKFPTPQTEQPQLWPEIRTIIETSIRDNPRSKQVELGPSELGTDSLHTLAAKLAGWPQRQTVGWLPYIGTAVHAQFEQLFPTLNPQGFDDKKEGKRFETEKRVTVGHLYGLYGGYDVSGSIDLYDRQNATTIDWKIVGPTTLRNVKANGISQQYAVQASLYGLGLANEEQPIERSAIYFLPRNAISLDTALPWETAFDPKPGRWALARAQLIVNLMDIIEQADGPDIRDQWISLLPASPTHDFSDGTWPDDDPLELNEDDNQTVVPDKWKQLIPLLEATYPNNK
ncbi:MAG: PDDEXK-1 domain-containing protein [Bifidobacterium crudilactis]|jgi:hypothetical protein|uniref:hypothetical protein n=1 Tax=Bifidobacterium crudilactis TaxID=327277 RepID=UPI003A5C661E